MRVNIIALLGTHSARKMHIIDQRGFPNLQKREMEYNRRIAVENDISEKSNGVHKVEGVA